MSVVLNKSHYGDEPILKITPEMDEGQVKAEMNRCLAWYSRFYDYDDRKKFLLAYLKKHNKDLVGKFKQLDKYSFSPSVCNVAKMLTRDQPVPNYYVDNLNVEIEKLEKSADWNISVHKNESDTEKPKISIQERSREKGKLYIADIEEQIDRFTDTYEPSEFSAYDYLSNNDVKGIYAVMIVDWMKPILEELEEVESESDEDLSEAYSSINWDELKNYKAFISGIIDDCNRYSNNKKTTRKPRKKKKKSADQIVTKVNYKVRDEKYKLASILPVNIVEASQLWVFNTKTRQLSVYHAIDRGGLTVKGTTIQNFDVKTSIGKTIRKPDVILKQVLNGGKIVLKRTMKSIKAKEKKLTGRINGDIILLRAVT